MERFAFDINLQTQMKTPKRGRGARKAQERGGRFSNARGAINRGRGSRGRGRRSRGVAAPLISTMPMRFNNPSGPRIPALLGPPQGLIGGPPIPNFLMQNKPVSLLGPAPGSLPNSCLPFQQTQPPHTNFLHHNDEPKWKFPINDVDENPQDNIFSPENKPFSEKEQWRERNKMKDDNPKVKPTLFPHGVPPIQSSFKMKDSSGETIHMKPFLDKQMEPPFEKALDSDIQKDSKTASNEIDAQDVPNPLVDPLLMEIETKKYYEEVEGSIQTDKGVKAQPRKKSTPPKEKPKPIMDTQTAWATMHEYWNYVQENPYDFDGWIRLLGHVEGMENIEAARSAFEGFLPLYPYCFAYWKKLSDFEKKYSNLDKCIGVLLCAINSVPLSTEIWIPLVDHFLDYARLEVLSDKVIRGFFELGLESVGLSWHGSLLWERAIAFETGKNDLLRTMSLYKRVVKVPLKVYNKHWDKLVALVRDNLPQELLSSEEYTHLRKLSCEEMKIVYTPLPKESSTTGKKTGDSNDKLTTTIREKIIAGFIRSYERTEKEVNKRSKYEEKIKRPYFHIKPLEKKQLKTWKDYLDYEIKQGDPVKIVHLFERCLIACAQYEEIWCKYCAYMEDHIYNVSIGKYAGIRYQPGCLSKPPESKKKLSMGDKSDLEKDVKDPTNKKDNEKEVSKENRDPATSSTEAAPPKKKKTSKTLESIDCPININLKEDSTPPSALETSISDPMLDKSLVDSSEIFGEDDLEVMSVDTRTEITSIINKLREDIGAGGRVLTCPPLAPKWILQEVCWEDVRQIYRRAAWIHCPSKPLILMQWAEFEESQDNAQTARELLNTVIVKYPELLKARLQLIELERRNGFLDQADQLYSAAFKASTIPSARSFVAIRYARFLFKIKEEDEKALMMLRKALKKDKGNSHLYHHVFDICYQRRPIDIDGVQAAVLLALASKELTLEQKFYFCQKRSNFLKEHGTLSQLKEAKIEYKEYKQKVDAKIAEEAKKAKEKEKMAEMEQSQCKWSDNRKLMLASEQAQNGHPHAGQIPPPPNTNSFGQQNYHGQNKNYNYVPPTFDLEHRNYGYGNIEEKDTKNQGEKMHYERYDELLSKGYNKRNGPPPPLHARNDAESYLPPPPIPMGILGESLFNQGRIPNAGERGGHHTPPEFRGPFNDSHNMNHQSHFGPKMCGPPEPPMLSVPSHGTKRPLIDTSDKPPKKIPILDTPPPLMGGPLNNMGPDFLNKPFPHEITPGSVLNIPNWLVTEGGEFILSSTNNGKSVIRYWPLFMNEAGHDKLLAAVRQSVQWFPPTRGTNEPPHQLLSWLGPCDYEKDGVFLKANTNWPPETVDLLHRLIRFLDHKGEQFNSCLFGLFITGNNFLPWTTEEHPAMNVKSMIATISLGVTRVIEMKRKDDSSYLRFPLFPGSLLVMEGATQQDWIHQIAPASNVFVERLSLSFRSMLMIKGITV